MTASRPGVIVTGSNGLIGRAVSARLLRSGYRVAALDRPDSSDPAPGADAMPCDVTSDDSVSEALTRVRRAFGDDVASVIHLAAYYDFSGESSPLYEEITVRGTERLLRQLTRVPLKLQQFVYAGSMLVHAPCALGERINEDWPLDPKWDYPKSKLAAERVVLAERGGLPVVLLRIAGVFSDACDSIPLANQIQRIYERRLTSKVFPGDTSNGQSFVDLDDVAEAFRAVVERRTQLPDQTVILIGEEDPVSYEELQRTFARLIHGEPDWETTRIPKAVAKAGAWVQDTIPGVEDPFIKPWMIDLADEHYALDTSRARAVLGWTPTHPLRAALPTMIAALRADPERWYRRNKLDGTPPAPPPPVPMHPVDDAASSR